MTLQDLRVNGRIILKWILEIKWEGVYWINLFQNRDKWLAVVNTVMNLWVPSDAGYSLTS